MTVPAQCEFILCNSHCSRFLPEKRLHSTGGGGGEGMDMRGSSNIKHSRAITEVRKETVL